MLARYFNAPMLLFLWQVAPVDLKVDHAGRVRLSLGVGAGAYAYHLVPSCGGPVREDSPYDARGAAAEAWLTSSVRVHGMFGWVTDGTLALDGKVAAGLVALERRNFGAGLGVASFSGTQGEPVSPSGMFRLGKIDGLHFRADYHFPDALLGLTTGPRAGLALNQGRGPGLRGFVGAGVVPAAATKRLVGAFADFAIPLGVFQRRAGLGLQGFLTLDNDQRPLYSGGLGFWIQP